MSTSEVTRNTRQFTVSFPPELAKQVEATAAREHRTVSELFREAFRTYVARQVDERLTRSQQLAKAAGYTKGDTRRLIEEARREMKEAARKK